MRWWLMLNDNDQPLRNENYYYHIPLPPQHSVVTKTLSPALGSAVLLCHFKNDTVDESRATAGNSWQSVYQHGSLGTPNAASRWALQVKSKATVAQTTGFLLNDIVRWCCATTLRTSPENHSYSFACGVMWLVLLFVSSFVNNALRQRREPSWGWL